MTTPPNPGRANDDAFDFVALQAQIVSASLRAFDDVARVHPNERLCAFALYSDDGAMTVCPAFDLASQRDARVGQHEDDADYYTFGTAEWGLEGFGADDAFEEICTAVRIRVMDPEVEDDDDAFASFRAELFETCLRALDRLRAEGAFDAHPGLLVMFAVSDSDPVPQDELRMMARLNGDSPYVAQYKRWTETWGG